MHPRDERDWDETVKMMSDWDVYHTASYASVFEDAFGFIPSLYGWSDRENGVVMPMLHRSVNALPFIVGWDEEYTDAVSPWYFGGPLFHRDNRARPQDILPRFLRSVDSYSEEQNVVATFLRFHPSLENHIGWPDAEEVGKVADIDLTRPWMDIVNSMSKPCRNAVSNARRKGITIQHDGERETFQSFTELYGEVMDQKETKDFYRFTGAFWNAISTHLYGKVEVFLALKGTDVIAASLQLFGNGHVSDYLRVQRESARGTNASNLMVYSQIDWARSRKFRSYHLGGGRGGAEDTQFAFKASFSGDVRPFYIWKGVHLPKVYERLVEGRDAFGGSEGTPGYYPSYRRGVGEFG